MKKVRTDKRRERTRPYNDKYSQANQSEQVLTTLADPILNTIFKSVLTSLNVGMSCHVDFGSTRYAQSDTDANERFRNVARARGGVCSPATLNRRTRSINGAALNVATIGPDILPIA